MQSPACRTAREAALPPVRANRSVRRRGCSDGAALARACRAVVGKEPRTLTLPEASLLINVTELCVRELEKPWALAKAHAATGLLLRPAAAYQAAILMVDTHTPGWPILFASSAATEHIGARARAPRPRAARL